MTEERTIKTNTEDTTSDGETKSPPLKKANTGKKEGEDELQNTILDNLARLLEGSSVCAAVCLYGKELFITQNELSKGSGSRGGAGYTVINNLINYLKNQNEDDEDSRLSVFRSVCRQKLSPTRFPGIMNVSKIEGEKTREEGIFCIIVKDLLKQEVKAETLNSKEIIKKFKIGNSGRDELASQIHRTYQVLDRAAHDFRKVEEAFENQNRLKKADLIIIQDTDSQGIHAELRIINHLFLKKGLLDHLANNKPLYVGISKLCCEKCRHAIKALNLLFSELNKPKAVETIQYDIKILKENAQSPNQDRSEGKIIIRQYKDFEEDIVEIFDYKQNKFINIEALEEKNKDIVKKINESINSVKNDEKHILAESLGCMKNIIRYADSSTRETHGLTAGEGNWVCPNFMDVKLKQQNFPYFYKENSKRATRNSIGEKQPRYEAITPEKILEKFNQLEREYKIYLETLVAQEDDFVYQDQSHSQNSPRSNPRTPESITETTTTTTVSQQITLDEVKTFIQNNPGDIGEVLETCYTLDMKDSFLSRLESVKKQLSELEESGITPTQQNFENLMKDNFRYEFSFKDEMDNYIGFIEKVEEKLSKMSSCNFKDFENLTQENYKECKNTSSYSPST